MVSRAVDSQKVEQDKVDSWLSISTKAVKTGSNFWNGCINFAFLSSLLQWL